MPYRSSGVQYDVNHVLNPQTPQDPIFSATSTPYLSSSPIYIRRNRVLLSAGVDARTNSDLDDSSIDNLLPSLNVTTDLPQSTVPVTLLSPFSPSSPVLPPVINDKGVFATAVQGAIDFLNRNGYSCYPTSTTPTVSSPTSDIKKTSCLKRKLSKEKEKSGEKTRSHQKAKYEAEEVDIDLESEIVTISCRNVARNLTVRINRN